jgi:LPXTG-site transpeptidase (sortase) family protein
MTTTDTSRHGVDEIAPATPAADPPIGEDHAAHTGGPLDQGRSASQILDSRQRQFLGLACLLLVIFLLFAPLAAVITVMATTTIAYFAVVTQRLVITKRSLDDSQVVRVSDEEARAIPDTDLPIYTVLVPAYREAQVIDALVAHLRAIEYPRGRLDVKLLLEEDDLETIDAARRAAPDLTIVLIPPGGPRTKPKALNAGLQSAYGEYVTIYDAEDMPDPLQLRRAVAAFRRLPDDVACLQAQLTFHNWDHNIITRWFTIEYLMWFTLFLPGLSSLNAPIPLGGTSNHIRRDVLESVGAWDAYNVTEDADLGIRLYAAGWQTEVLESETLEEPNGDFVNWVKQRSRWYKGYLQTWFVHLRHPVQLWRTVGPGGFLQFNLFVGGTPMLALLNPFFWLLALVWFTGHATLIEEIFPAPLYHLALFCWIVGNVVVLYVTILGARRSNRTSLFWAACLVPAYWVMMSIAAIKAFWQVIAAPSFWEKTTHGLTVGSATPSPEARDSAVPFPPLSTTLGSPEERAPGEYWGDAPGGIAGSNGGGDRTSRPAWVSGNGSGESRRTALPPPAPVLIPRAPALEPPTPEGRAVRSRLVPLGRSVSVVGLLAALFVGYVVIGTGWEASHAQHGLGHALATTHIGAPHIGSPVARIVAPHARLDAVVIEGVGEAQLRQAPGHVPGTANPGGAGNVVIVGHRVAAGGPFSRLGRLRRGDMIELLAPWGPSRYRVTAVGTRAAGTIDVFASRAAQLTLVTSGSGLNLAQRLVVDARLTGPPRASVPKPARQAPRLPGPDTTAPPLLLAAVVAALLACQIGRWLAVTWGRVRAALFVAPFVAIALAEVFTVGVRLLPATF